MIRHLWGNFEESHQRDKETKVSEKFTQSWMVIPIIVLLNPSFNSSFLKQLNKLWDNIGSEHYHSKSFLSMLLTLHLILCSYFLRMEWKRGVLYIKNTLLQFSLMGNEPFSLPQWDFQSKEGFLGTYIMISVVLQPNW